MSLPEVCSGMLLPAYSLPFHVPSWYFLNSIFLTLLKSHFTFYIFFFLLFQKYNILTAQFLLPNLLVYTFFPIYFPFIYSNYHQAWLFFLKQLLLIKTLQKKSTIFNYIRSSLLLLVDVSFYLVSSSISLKNISQRSLLCSLWPQTPSTFINLKMFLFQHLILRMLY